MSTTYGAENERVEVHVWDLARLWYGNHLSPDWRKWTPAEARDIFERVGLVGDFWDIPLAEKRF